MEEVNNINIKDDAPKMIMMIGIVGSGKSTYAKKIAEENNAVIHASDELREELYGDMDIQDKNGELFTELHRRIKADLKAGKSVVYDATNINSKKRMAFIRELNNIECNKIAYVMATPYEKCIEQNNSRKRKVPEHVIKKMYTRFDIPYWYEGWNEIKLVYANTPNKDLNDFMYDYLDYNQDNSNHELTLGVHCVTCGNIVMIKTHSLDMSFAAILHDCGKPFVKQFENSKGEQTEEAHYYNHEHVGSYDSMFYRYYDGEDAVSKGDLKVLKVATLINLHMIPYMWEREERNGNVITANKMINKYKKLWGEELFNEVMILHEADKSAH